MIQPGGLIGASLLIALASSQSALASSPTALASTTTGGMDIVSKKITKIVISDGEAQSAKISKGKGEHTFKKAGPQTFGINPNGLVEYIKSDEE